MNQETNLSKIDPISLGIMWDRLISITNEIVQAHVVCNANSITITLNANPADSALLVTIIG